MGRHTNFSLIRYAAFCAGLLVFGVLGETTAHASRQRPADPVIHDSNQTPPPQTTPPRPVATDPVSEAKTHFDQVKARWKKMTDALGRISLRAAKKRMINSNQPPLGSTCAKSTADGGYKEFAAILHLVDPKAYDEDDNRPAGLVISAYGEKTPPDYFAKRNKSWQEANAEFQVTNRAILDERRKYYNEYVAWKEVQNDNRKAQAMQIYADRIARIDQMLAPQQKEVDEWIADEEEEANDYYLVKKHSDGSRELLLDAKVFSRRDRSDHEHPGELVYTRQEADPANPGKRFISKYDVGTEDNGNVLVHKQKIDPTTGSVVEEVVCW